MTSAALANSCIRRSTSDTRAPCLPPGRAKTPVNIGVCDQTRESFWTMYMDHRWSIFLGFAAPSFYRRSPLAQRCLRPPPRTVIGIPLLQPRGREVPVGEPQFPTPWRNSSVSSTRSSEVFFHLRRAGSSGQSALYFAPHPPRSSDQTGVFVEKGAASGATPGATGGCGRGARSAELDLSSTYSDGSFSS